jgi:hypothetical protein
MYINIWYIRTLSINNKKKLVHYQKSYRENELIIMEKGLTETQIKKCAYLEDIYHSLYFSSVFYAFFFTLNWLEQGFPLSHMVFE